MKVLYLAHHGLGDVIMSLKTMEFLHNEGIHLTVMVKSAAEMQYIKDTQNFKISDFIILSKYKNKKLRSLVALAFQLIPKRFNFVIPQVNSSKTKYKILLYLTRSQNKNKSFRIFKKLSNDSDSHWHSHKVNINFRIARDILGYTDTTGEIARFRTKSINKNRDILVAFAPGSGVEETHKRWPPHNFAKLAIQLIQAFPSIDIRIYGAPWETSLCKEIEQLSAGQAKFKQVGSAVELYHEMKKFDVCVTNCNGASHVAGHAGAHVVAIYGPTSASHTGPYNDNYTHVSNNLTCSPCYRKGFNKGCGDPICITDISPETVFSALYSLLQKSKT